MGDLQKTDCYGLNSERKKVLTSSPGPLTCLLINLSAFGSMNIHFLSEKLILLDFSSPRGVTTLGCEFHSQAGLATLHPESEVRVRSLIKILFARHGVIPRPSPMKLRSLTSEEETSLKKIKKAAHSPISLMHIESSNTSLSSFLSSLVIKVAEQAPSLVVVRSLILIKSLQTSFQPFQFSFTKI